MPMRNRSYFTNYKISVDSKNLEGALLEWRSQLVACAVYVWHWRVHATVPDCCLPTITKYMLRSLW